MSAYATYRCPCECDCRILTPKAANPVCGLCKAGVHAARGGEQE